MGDCYLHMTFPDVPTRCPLSLGEGYRFRVSISGDSSALYGVPDIDVVVLCSRAGVEPLRGSLRLPPDPEGFVEFTLTPKMVGILEVEVLLLVANQTVDTASISRHVLANTL